ncbi:hypothetical protein BC941DRAFT_440069 [Chlamydoabsidia padenii]|nr:hypothetical protein BC941DRAFT_440069 [Chlamydoabsidia padenii]
MIRLEESSLSIYHDDQVPSVSLISQQSIMTDEGYSSDEKQHQHPITEIDTDNGTEQEQEAYQQRSKSDRDIPILKSTRTIRITYTLSTYTLTLAIIILSARHLINTLLTTAAVTALPPTFSTVFTSFHIIFQFTHLIAHLFERLTLERHCVVYGTWLFWTGWLLVFYQRQQQQDVITTLLFWLLMLERRNAWGILVWEYVSRLDQNLICSGGVKWWQIGSIRLLAFRIWCLLGTGSFWGLMYLILVKPHVLWRHVFQLLLVSVAGGLMMIIFWSFWTFQYRGILWHHELRKGVVVWYSEGLAFAGDIE